MNISGVSREHCTGCGACKDSCHKGCISMVGDELGFVYPKIDESRCIECGNCLKKCPVSINNIEIQYPIECKAARNRNHEILYRSSSGGVFWSLAEKIINIYNGVVFGVKFDDNWMAVHSYSEDLNGVKNFLGSKYIQSKIGNSYIDCLNFLDQGRWVLFSGTPCQISALKLFLGKDYERLITIDLICHGVPSPLVWEKYKNKILKKKKKLLFNGFLPRVTSPKIISISFRDKKNGWNQFGLSIRYKYEDKLFTQYCVGKVEEFYESIDKNAFLKGFLDNLYLRESCYNCHFKEFRGCADITLGDCWGIEKHNTNFQDNRGVSVVLLNNEKGQHYLNNIESIEGFNVNLNDVIFGNPSLVSSPGKSKAHNLFVSIYYGKNKYISIFKYLLHITEIKFKGLIYRMIVGKK